GFEFHPEVLQVRDDGLRSVSLVDIERQWVGQHQRVMREVERYVETVRGMRGWMPFPTQAGIEGEPAVHSNVVLEIEIDLLIAVVAEGSTLRLAITGRGAKEEIRILVSGIRLDAVIRPGRRIVEARCLIRERNRVRGAVRQIPETLMPVAAAKLYLM